MCLEESCFSTQKVGLSSRSHDPRVSIVIINVGGTGLLEECLRSLFDTDYPEFEIVIVDLNTQDVDKFLENLGERSVKIKLIRLSQDPGLSALRNMGFRACDESSKYVVFLDNDVSVTPKWLKPITSVMETDSTIGVAQGKVLFESASKRIQSTGCFIDLYGRAYLRGLGNNDKGQYEQPTSIFSASGCTMITRRSALLAVGLFDEKILFGCDDIDICWRMRLAGYSIMYFPDSKVFHKLSATSSNMPEEVYTYRVTRSRLLVLLRNHRFKEAVLSFGVNVLAIARANFRDAGKRRGLVLARTKAIAWILLNLDSIIRDRGLLVRLKPLDNYFDCVRGGFLRKSDEYFLCAPQSLMEIEKRSV
jgi:hypothetical protein